MTLRAFGYCIHILKGPYIAHLRTPVPTTIPCIAFGTRVLDWTICGPLGQCIYTHTSISIGAFASRYLLHIYMSQPLAARGCHIRTVGAIAESLCRMPFHVHPRQWLHSEPLTDRLPESSHTTSIGTLNWWIASHIAPIPVRLEVLWQEYRSYL